MPSQSRLNFERFLLRDVEELRDLHRNRFRGRGRPHSFLTRSAIFLLCAAWELYCEDVINEASDFVIDRCDDPNLLPEQVRRTIASAVKADRHDLAAIRLAGLGWRDYLREIRARLLGQLNTPSVANVSILLDKVLGLDLNPVLAPHEAALSAFIAKRGEIAHRGAEAGHISIVDLEADYEFICNLVVEFDNSLIEPIRAITEHRPWNRRRRG